MTTLTEWRAPFQVNTGNASIGHQFAPQVIGLSNGWFMVAWREQFGEGAPGNGQDVVAKIYDADGNVEFDYFTLHASLNEGDQGAFDFAPTHDGFAVMFGFRIERHFDDLTYLYGDLTSSGGIYQPQIAVNLLPTNDDIFIVHANAGALVARVIDENDTFLPTFPALDPATNSDVVRLDEAVVLSNGNLASLTWNGVSNVVSIAAPDGSIQSEGVVARFNTVSREIARDLASLADGGYVVVGVGGTTGQKEIFARIYDNAGLAVTEIVAIEIPGYTVDDPRVAALPDGSFVVMFQAGLGRYHAQVFNVDGTHATAPVLVGDGGFFGSQPELTVTADGRIVFVWRGEEGSGLNTEIFSSIWDPRGEVIDPDDYGQLRANILATDTITTGVNGSTVLEGEIGDTILGQGGDDTIYTSGSGDFWGGGGDDLFILSPTVPLPGDFRYINGETGFDTLDTRAVSVDYTIDLATGAASRPGAPTTPDEEFLNIENLITGEGNDTVTGSDRWNVIETNGGDDTVNGGLGNDVLRGGLGNDTLNGEEGNDRLNGGDGDDTLNGGLGNDRIYAQAGNDTVDGGDGNDHIEGKSGDDNISGGLGDDMLRGGEGADELSDGAGDDMGYGGDGDDTLLGGIGNDLLNGNGGSDIIDGGAGDDTLAGENGVDVINGGTGDDVLRGGGGNDTLNGDAGNDLLFGGANDDILTGGDGNDILDGMTQADVLLGGAGDDILRGGDGFDTLDGGLDNDILAGGNGRDTLTGGLGVDTLRGNAQDDTFIFNSTAESTGQASDLIDGFEGAGVADGDIIDLSGIDADATLAGDQVFSFLGAVSSAVGTSFGPGSLWVEEFGGQTRLFGNTDFDGVIEFSIRINDGPGTAATDYAADDFIL